MSIEVRNLSLKIANKNILNSVSLAIGSGDIVGIIGPNGAGKSSLVKLIAGDHAATNGDVLYNDRPLHTLSNRDQALHRAVVEQHVDLSFPMLVKQIVALGWLAECGDRQQMLNAIDLALQALGIAHLATQNYATLSGGEKQRVQISRALVQLQHQKVSQRYLLLDEPTSSLDLFHQIQLMRLLQQQALQGIGVLIVLHDLNLAANYTTKLLVLEKGAVVMFDHSQKVMHSRCLSAVYKVDLDVQTDQARTTVFVS